MNDIKPGIYKHFKTENMYKVLGIAKHSETLEDFVVYEALYENEKSKLWVRPVEMFLEEVEVNGIKSSRFVFVEN